MPPETVKCSTPTTASPPVPNGDILEHSESVNAESPKNNVENLSSTSPKQADTLPEDSITTEVGTDGDTKIPNTEDTKLLDQLSEFHPIKIEHDVPTPPETSEPTTTNIQQDAWCAFDSTPSDIGQMASRADIESRSDIDTGNSLDPRDFPTLPPQYNMNDITSTSERSAFEPPQPSSLSSSLIDQLHATYPAISDQQPTQGHVPQCQVPQSQGQQVQGSQVQDSQGQSSQIQGSNTDPMLSRVSEMEDINPFDGSNIAADLASVNSLPSYQNAYRGNNSATYMTSPGMGISHDQNQQQYCPMESARVTSQTNGYVQRNTSEAIEPFNLTCPRPKQPEYEASASPKKVIVPAGKRFSILFLEAFDWLLAHCIVTRFSFLVTAM